MPLYWPLQTFAAITALVELRIRPYFWAKTEHGFTKAPEPECRLPSPSSCSSPPLPPLRFALGRPAASRTPQKGPRLIPWTLLAITFGFLLLILLAHLVSFVGIETGGRFNDRMGI